MLEGAGAGEMMTTIVLQSSATQRSQVFLFGSVSNIYAFPICFLAVQSWPSAGLL